MVGVKTFLGLVLCAWAPGLSSNIGLHGCTRALGAPDFPLRTMQDKREPELIAACKLGDNVAGTELLGRHYASSLRLARGILRSEEESQDAVQSAYFSALRYIRNFRGDAKFKTWITRIVMNECIARLRDRKRRRDWISLDDRDRSPKLNMASSAPTPEKFTLSQEIASALSDAASILPKSLRDVFALCAFSGRSLEETARELGLTVRATKTRLFRAHARLRSQLRPMWSDASVHSNPRKNANQLRCGLEARLGEAP